MATPTANCPSCGAPIQFALGSSIAKVCEYCRHTVVRSDRGLQSLGKVADLAETPALVSIGDEGTIAGRPFRVFGRVQLNHGKGPWDEYYIALDHGQSWAWLAHAQGEWFVTSWVTGVATPPFESLRLEADIPIGPQNFRVAEIHTARITSAEGELPGAFPNNYLRRYADLRGPRLGFATLDYGDAGPNGAAFVGNALPETELKVVALGPRSQRKVKVTALKCPSCGGDVPALTPERSERLGCPYCGALSDIAERRIIAQQEQARQAPVIPIGTRGTLDGVAYVCLAWIRRGSDYEGELYEWEEFLLYAEGLGYRFLVLDPETGWSFVTALSVADLDLRSAPASVVYAGQAFAARNQAYARVLYVLGEVYWQCEVGESVSVSDFVCGDTVLSREASATEVLWSLSRPLDWSVIAAAFGLSEARRPPTPRNSISAQTIIFLVVMGLLLCAVLVLVVSNDEENGGTTSSGYRGGGVFIGGK